MAPVGEPVADRATLLAAAARGVPSGASGAYAVRCRGRPYLPIPVAAAAIAQRLPITLVAARPFSGPSERLRDKVLHLVVGHAGEARTVMTRSSRPLKAVLGVAALVARAVALPMPALAGNENGLGNNPTRRTRKPLNSIAALLAALGPTLVADELETKGTLGPPVHRQTALLGARPTADGARAVASVAAIAVEDVVVAAPAISGLWPLAVEPALGLTTPSLGLPEALTPAALARRPALVHA